jgi:hypothetical protein
MTSSAGGVHEHSAQGCAEVLRSQRTGCILRDHVDSGNAKRRRLISSEKPCRSVNVEDYRMTTGTRRVNADGLYVTQRAEDVRFEQVRMTGNGGWVTRESERRTTRTRGLLSSRHALYDPTLAWIKTHEIGTAS